MTEPWEREVAEISTDNQMSYRKTNRAFDLNAESFMAGANQDSLYSVGLGTEQNHSIMGRRSPDMIAIQDVSQDDDFYE